MVVQRKPYKRVQRKPMKKTSAVAKLTRKVNKLTALSKSITKPIYYAYAHDGDLAGTGGAIGNNCYEFEITKAQGSVLFQEDGVQGDKARCDWHKLEYEIHMDNLNNEEETCNFTVSVIKFKGAYFNNANLNYVANGMVFWNPDLVQVLSQRRHTLTMGGVSPGTAGQMIARGKIFTKIGKTIRFISRGATGHNTAIPSDDSHQYWVCIHTDNTSVDLENPRLNALSITKWTDLDVNY